DPAISVDNFDEQVATLAGPLDGVQPPAPDLLHGVDWSAARHWRLPLPAATSSLLADLWTRLAGVPGRWCLWWASGAGRMPASLLITDGLPQADAYAGFLDAGRGAAAWRSMGFFDDPGQRAALPDDLELLPGPGESAVSVSMASSTAAMEPLPVVVADSGASMAVLHRADVGLSLVAAEAGTADSRQQAVAAVAAIAGDMLGAELIGGLQVLRTRIMALNPQLRQVSEDLIDPMQEDCAVIAAHVADERAELLRIGAAAAWHWRHGRLQPFFARSDALPAVTSGRSDDIDDLLFSPAPLAAPGLGATAQPTCSEVSCA